MTLYASPGRDLAERPAHTLHGTWLDVVQAVDEGQVSERGMIDHLRRPEESKTSTKKRVGSALTTLVKIEILRRCAGRLVLTTRGHKALTRARGHE